ncbi:YggS family pyridoxal phosphate-dependent enzyme [Candidatus Peregrinibacteria bacterium CG22_combo_CG10-13_8_21_14_all_44_10]|nr:MAG: YggS family pyridoxal phosphate enzyme [Candidatus Peregrinibacteria bacterium CG2_30_44_17]PIP65908.1 MAG: YggS family pyridoxal phosphate-dependent enzyme [Candidatus Peregrinibacteria bacterium CG22_combo_CG10-13_8_21_14_all_44_10]PIX79757.1 MAG: YggS family pyridoxal phosphate-dependent enzyme [Candidatus Peregrinibacteria bacterium CG_4_10_14_3_um_filter_44_21]PJB88367.1 MAG: YggS family pyridoxal phosphate-dependent enzyme [Candidatus Peregrinibacteria bacterium CG_4_9_14_0_8_um_fi
MTKTMAVTKGRSLEEILKIIRKHNISIVGENRIKEACEKFPELTGVEKHFIGHLQTNKAAMAVNLCDVIETIDSEKLAKAVNKAAEKLGKTQRIYIQVNISRENQKGGILEEHVQPLIETVSSLPSLKLEGLMTIAEDTSDQLAITTQFNRMKKLQKKYHLKELSMGMSQDYQLAIKCGATIVRLGRMLFD